MKTKFLIPFLALLPFLFPNASYAVNPTLGTVTNFNLFTTAGAITNTGVSIIVGGAIGTDAGAINACENINCVQHTQDAATAQCTKDLRAAFDEIHSFPINYELVEADLPLRGVYKPGVYHIFMAATLTTSLTLDAQNDPNAQFIINITGAFAASAGTKIILINGALAKMCSGMWMVQWLLVRVLP